MSPIPQENSLPGGMVQTLAPLLVHQHVAQDHFLIRLKAPAIARRAKPGQFIHVRCGGPLLRRPLSLMNVNPPVGTVDFVYKVVGLGTGLLSRVPVGSYLDLLGPLGHPFEVPAGLKTGYLIGGGVGIPPLVFLAKHLVRKGVSVAVFLGARTKEWVICGPEFRRLGVPVQAATDDGTLGFKGSVVALFEKFFRSQKGDRGSATLYICGPTPMMAAAAAMARREKMRAQVSLEERMGCAMGCCLGCAVEIATEPTSSHSRFQRVCTEGPVFPAEEIAWR